MKKILLLCLLLLSFTACKTIEDKNEQASDSNKTTLSTHDSTSTKLTTSTTVDSSAEQSTKQVLSDPKEIYSALKGEWFSKEIDGNNVQWQATFTDESAIISPVSGVSSPLNFQNSSLDWDSENQRLTIAVEAYDSNGARSPENDYFLAVHAIDFTNFSQMSVFGTTFATTDVTYYRK